MQFTPPINPFPHEMGSGGEDSSVAAAGKAQAAANSAAKMKDECRIAPDFNVLSGRRGQPLGPRTFGHTLPASHRKNARSLQSCTRVSKMQLARSCRRGREVRSDR